MNEVMIIDDNEFYATYIEKVLEKENVRTVKYLNPIIALDDIIEEKIKPKVIFLDVMMPIMNGYEILEKFQEQNLLSKTLVIVCTASDVPDDIKHKYDTKNVQFLSKPISAASVLSSFKALVN